MSKLQSFYNFDALMGRQATYNMVCGARGLGKTYGAKKKAINDYIRKGWEFIYLRRYDTELQVNKGFFTDIAHEWPDWEFRTNGRTLEGRPVTEAEDDEPWQTMGRMMALSVAQSFKSVSFANVHTIIFDEFIAEGGFTRYLPAEPTRFNDFYSTVDRYQDRVKVFFLANAVSATNPYFVEYNIHIRPDQEWYTRANGFLVLHTPGSEAFMSEVRQTRFGQFIEATDPTYAEYAIANKFLDNTDTLIERKSENARPMFTLVTPRGMMGIWVDHILVYVTAKEAGDRPHHCNERTLVDEETTYVGYSSPQIAYLRNCFEAGRVRFQSATIRDRFLEVYRRG